MAASPTVTRDSVVRIMLDKSRDDDVAPFAWRKAYRYNPDFHEADYDPVADARSDLKAAREEFPGHTATLEVLVTVNPDAPPADQRSEWRTLKEA